jgi:hypothetical protein
MRATGGAGEVPVPACELFSRSEILGRMAMSKMPSACRAVVIESDSNQSVRRSSGPLRQQASRR